MSKCKKEAAYVISEGGTIKIYYNFGDGVNGSIHDKINKRNQAKNLELFLGGFSNKVVRKLNNEEAQKIQ